MRRLAPFVLLFAFAFKLAAQQPQHPLDPLGFQEYWAVLETLDADGKLDRDTRFSLVSLVEPPKALVWGWKAGDPIPRKARAVVRQGSDAKLNIELAKPTLWRMVSTTRKNKVGYPTSYQLMPGRTTETLLSEDDYPRRRARFIEHHLWVTPFNAAERFPAGDYPTLSTPDQGLPEWTQNDRGIDNTDIVLWHTIGMHHLVRAEDWPVMPVMWHSFELRPFDFFDANPAMDLPE